MARPSPSRSSDASRRDAELRRAGLLAALGRNVRGLRGGLGLSQQALALQAGLSPRFVAQLEAGEANISVAKLAELARALGVPVERLLALDARGPGPNGDAAPRGAPLIALVGLRGAGKSTVGPLLAEALGRPFVELDQEIGALTGLAVSEIFELHGEDYYREAERQALERFVARGEPAVLAVSGGAVADARVFRLLRERTLLVWVRATPEQHMQRVASQGDRRPMANRPDPMTELRDLLAARTPYYAQARLTVDTSRASPAQCVAQLVAQLGA
jgi:XRE family transcriptional regulator, aerobic/anaerobic benzoate catabolism transcriptional regulator